MPITITKTTLSTEDIEHLLALKKKGRNVVIGKRTLGLEKDEEHVQRRFLFLIEKARKVPVLLFTKDQRKIVETMKHIRFAGIVESSPNRNYHCPSALYKVTGMNGKSFLYYECAGNIHIVK